MANSGSAAGEGICENGWRQIWPDPSLELVYSD
jgi:hypothetical protein